MAVLRGSDIAYSLLGASPRNTLRSLTGYGFAGPLQLQQALRVPTQYQIAITY